MFFCEPTTNCEHKAQKFLRTGGKSPSMFCECIWGGGRSASPPAPLQLFFFKAYLLCRESPPPIETSPPPIETIKKNNSQNTSAPWLASLVGWAPLHVVGGGSPACLLFSFWMLRMGTRHNHGCQQQTAGHQSVTRMKVIWRMRQSQPTGFCVP